METRANYTLLGAFVIAVLFGAAGFTLWAAKLDKGRAMSEYEIFIEENVTGLALNSDVLFCGIRVGYVAKITLSHSDPGAVKVLVKVASDTPVRDDSEATLENKGLTGVLLISISGGTAESKLVDVKPGETGQIRYKQSPLAAVMANVPSTVLSTNQILHSINQILSPANQQAIGQTLQSLAKVSETLAKRSDSIDRILLSAERTALELEQTSRNLNALLGTAGKESPGSVASAAKRADAILAALEPGMKRFSKEGLMDIKMLLVESRGLVQVLTRIGQQLEDDPRRFLFGDTIQEYKAP